MRRLFEWLDVGHLFSNVLHIVLGVACLAFISAALIANFNTFGVAPDVQPIQVAALPAAVSSDAEDSAHSAILTRFVPASFDAELQEAVAITPLRIETVSLEEERRCLAAGIYFEARGESVEGQLAVAEVILNRVKSGQYADTICGVVFQGASKLNRCQFSFACDGKSAKPRDMVAWRKATRLARYVMMGQPRDPLVGHATYYHAMSVNPDWAQHMVEVKKIGRHIFYKKSDRRS